MFTYAVVRGTRKPVPNGEHWTVQQLGSVDTSATVPASKPMPLKQSGVSQVKTVLSFMQRKQKIISLVSGNKANTALKAKLCRSCDQQFTGLIQILYLVPFFDRI